MCKKKLVHMNNYKLMQLNDDDYNDDNDDETIGAVYNISIKNELCQDIDYKLTPLFEKSLFTNTFDKLQVDNNKLNESNASSSNDLTLINPEAVANGGAAAAAAGANNISTTESSSSTALSSRSSSPSLLSPPLISSTMQLNNQTQFSSNNNNELLHSPNNESIIASNENALDDRNVSLIDLNSNEVASGLKVDYVPKGKIITINVSMMW